MEVQTRLERGEREDGASLCACGGEDSLQRAQYVGLINLRLLSFVGFQKISFG